MTTDALDELRANLIDGIATAQSRSRAVRRRALAAAVTVGVSLAALLMAWVESGDNAALAITRDAHWLTVRLADENATPEEIERELRVAGIDADVRLVPARADAVGKWLFVEVEPPSVQAPTLEDRAEVQLVQLVNHDVRIRADFDGKVYLTAGRVAKRDEYCGPGGTVDDLSPTSEPEPPPEPCVP
jgi:hypothetical protein